MKIFESYDYWSDHPRERYYMEQRNKNRRHNAGRRPGEKKYVNIEKAIPVWAIGTALTIGGMLTGYVTAQDEAIRKDVKEVEAQNHQQDLAVRELQIRMDQMLHEQRQTNSQLNEIGKSLRDLSDVVRRAHNHD